jgi:hypothetical protein
LKLPRITKGEAGVLSISLAVFDDRAALNKAVSLGKAREGSRTNELTARRGLISSQRLARIRVIIFRRRGESGGEADNRDAEAAERERLRDEDKHVVSIGWGDGGKTIEHEAKSEPSPKD